MKVGRVTRIDGVRVVATFYERLQPFLIADGTITSSPRINSFIKTSVGLDTVICQIVGEHEIEYDRQGKTLGEHQEPQGPFLVDLEVRGHVVDGSFKGGLRLLPIVGAVVETLDESDLAMIHDSNVVHAIRLGNDLFDESSVVEINANKLMAGHIGIFGNTGSGKSNTLAKVLREYAAQFKRDNKAARIIVFDLNNEYGGDAILAEEEKSIYPLNTRSKDGSKKKVPLDFKLLDEDSWGTLLRATQKTQMPVVRRACRRFKKYDDNALVEELKKALVDKRATLFQTLREYSDDYISGIEDISYNSTCNTFYYEPWSSERYINGINTITEAIEIRNDISDLEKFFVCLLYEVARAAESGTNFDYVQPLLPRAKQVIYDLDKVFENIQDGKMAKLFLESNFVVVQLGNTNTNTRELVPALLVELLMKKAIKAKGNGKPSTITTIAIDEAHNLLAYDNKQEDLIHDNTLRIFERLVKEGRKFGVFLCAASQRPSDISPTITSQLHNFFIHKLVNPNDIERIRKTVSFMGDGSLSMLSALGQGECILTGPALHMPQYIYVHQLAQDYKPNSDDVIIFGKNGLIPDKPKILDEMGDEYEV